MKKEKEPPIKINSISGLHNLLGLPKPLHPLVSVIDNKKMIIDKDFLPGSFLFDFYKISYKKIPEGKMGYGQNYYDFDDGGLVFIAPNQLVFIETNDADSDLDGFSLIFCPDFIRNHQLSKNIKQYRFFSYDTHEALHLSEKEKTIILAIFKNIQNEMDASIDEFSQDVLISYIELLLKYSNRFYKRQFITRRAVNHELLSKLEQLLDEYFDNENSLNTTLPTVKYLAAKVNLSPRYLSDMLRALIGKNAQQLIHEKLIEKAKEKLSTAGLSVSEIAYGLGYEHPQSLSKLFKAKTNLSPLEFRQLFN